MEIWQHWIEVGDQNFKKQVLESLNLFLVKSGGYFWLIYFVFSFVLAEIQNLILVFLPISQLLQATWSGLV